MRKMFSKNQIAVIAKNVLDNNEILSLFTYNEIRGELTISCNLLTQSIIMGEDTELRAQRFVVPDFSYIYNGGDDSLQDKLDEKQDVVSVDSAYTFGLDLTNHKLYNSNKTGLTSEEIASLKANFSYWIKKGYISLGTDKYKIDYCSDNGTTYIISMSYAEYEDTGSGIAISTCTSIYAKLESGDAEYYYHETSL